MAETLRERLHGETRLVYRYPTVEGPAEPVELFGRLTREAISLRRSGLALLADVPQGTAGARSWPALNRLLERHAASLAVTATLARRFADRHPPEQVSALLAELCRQVPEILLETVGGEERLARLIEAAPAGADLDLACVACCRGLAIQAIHSGRDLAGVLEDWGSDDRGRQTRRHGTQRAPQERRCVRRRPRAARRGGIS